MTFCTICIVWITVCLCILSAEETIKANVRSTVTLPCKLRVQSETPYIRWSTDMDVFERSGKDVFQGQGYEGRVDISEEKLREGDCSLVLHNLTHSDTGVYMSYQAERRTKRSVKDKWSLLSVVQLSVNEPPVSKETNDMNVFEATGDARVNCPQAQVLVLSIFSCFLLQLFYQET